MFLYISQLALFKSAAKLLSNGPAIPWSPRHVLSEAITYRPVGARDDLLEVRVVRHGVDGLLVRDGDVCVQHGLEPQRQAVDLVRRHEQQLAGLGVVARLQVAADLVAFGPDGQQRALVVAVPHLYCNVTFDIACLT